MINSFVTAETPHAWIITEMISEGEGVNQETAQVISYDPERLS